MEVSGGLLAPVKDFLARYRNETLGRPEAEEIVAAIWALYRHLLGGTAHGVEAVLDTEGLDQLADCIQVVFRYDYFLEDAAFV